MNPTDNAKGSPAWEEWVIDFVDGTLPPDQAERLKELMASDRAVAQAVEAQRPTQRLLRQAFHTPVPSAFQQRLLVRLELITQTRSYWIDAVADTSEDDILNPIDLVLQAYLDDELPPPMREAVEAALRKDPSLAAQLNGYAQVQREIRLSFDEPVGLPFTERLSERLTYVSQQLQASQETSWRRKVAALLRFPSPRAYVWGTAAAALFAAATLSYFLWPRPSAGLRQEHRITQPNRGHYGPELAGSPQGPEMARDLPLGPKPPEAMLDEEGVAVGYAAPAVAYAEPVVDRLTRAAHEALARWGEKSKRPSRFQVLESLAQPSQAPLRSLPLQRSAAAPRNAGELRERLNTIDPHAGSLIAWEEDGKLHCAVIVDVRRASDTVSLLCSEYNITVQRQEDAAGPNSLIVLELPRDRARELVQSMKERFRVAAAAAVEGSKSEADQKALVVENLEQGTVAVQLPIPPGPRVALMQFVRDIAQSRAATLAGRGSVRSRRAGGSRSRTSAPGHAQDQVTLFLYLLTPDEKSKAGQGKPRPN